MTARPGIHDVDAAIVGGGVAGSATALLLKRRMPEARVLLVEQNDAFDRKVGESTVEISSFFLARVLKLYDYLSREQLPKQGFRYWFTGAGAETLETASEVGPSQLARTPSFQLDRQRLDEDLLAMAAREGVEIWRPARLVRADIPEDGAPNALTIDRGGEERIVRARWAIDASGRATLFARQMHTRRANLDHPTSAIWARFSGVLDLDGVACSGADPDDPWFQAVAASRRLATNHFTGYGYWWWFIPLRNGDTSVGIVWDKRLVDAPDGGLEERLRRFADRNPLVRRMLAGAVLCGRDIKALGHLPYFVDRVCGRGWALVGDAAGFLDPFYSPGLDHLAFSAVDRVALVEKDLRGGGVPDAEIEKSNRIFTRFLRSFFDAVYRDKYALMGDYDLMTASFLIDTASYYFVAVRPAYRKSFLTLRHPPFGDAGGEVGLRLVGFYNRRLVRIARCRRSRGTYGKRNAGRRPGLVGFSLGAASAWMLVLGLGYWARAEAEHALSHLSPASWLPRARRFLVREVLEILLAFTRPPGAALRDALEGRFRIRRTVPGPAPGGFPS